MRIIVSLAVLAALSSPALAGRWTKTDSAFEVVTLLTLAVDRYQTGHIIRDSNVPHHLVEEWNPIIGHHGEKVSPDAYFLTVASAQIVLAAVLPQPYRRILQVAVIAVEVKAVGVNWSAGYRFEF